MEICKVTGNVWATKKDPRLSGQRFLVVKRMITDEQQKAPVNLSESSATLVAVDNIGAGFGDLVLVAFGGAARKEKSSADIPIDAAIIGIIDSVDLQV